MKKIIIIFNVLFAGVLLFAQSLTNSENYVHYRAYLEPVTSSSNTAKQIETVQYFDGLGRSKQIVNVKASPTGKDIVAHVEYDSYGRQAKNYLPIPQAVTQNGAIYSSPLANATSIYGGEKIYSEKIFDDSPINRILQQKNVGNDWNTKPINFGYDVNVQSDYVKKFKVVTNWNNDITNTTINYITDFANGELYKNIVSDEDGNVSIEFKNGLGQTILIRKKLSPTENVDTYYIYNEYDQLVLVMPPKATFAFFDEYGAGYNDYIPENIINDLCYQYKYDTKNRLVEKKLPGKGWEFMVYDKADRLVLSQDANMRVNSNWLITKYDQWGRVAYTGLIAAGTNRQGVQDQINNTVLKENRTTSGFTKNGITIEYSNYYFHDLHTVLSVNYYDTYPQGSPSSPSNIFNNAILTQDAQNSNISTKSFPVASYVKNIEDDNWTKTYTWYDTKGRPIGSHTINHLGGYTKTENELDFSGIIKQSKTYHKRLSSDAEKIVKETFEYDHQNRLLTHRHQVDSNPEEILAQNSYNEISQLTQKKVGGKNPNTPLQTINYAYNIRGLMTGINDPNNLGDDLFAYKIKYNHVDGLATPDASDTNLVVTPKYNGNIAEVDWKTSSQENEPLKRYGYVYDGLNRLLAGFYQNSTNPSLREYYEKLTYDLNGNIKTLQRTAERRGATAMVIDNLTYQYESNNQSNRLQKISETIQTWVGYPYKATPTDITYDENGNMTSQMDKGISSIQYNFLNLPKQITQNGQITNYLYRADGVKLKKLYGTVETHYLDGFQYKYTDPWEDESGTLMNSEMRLRIIPTSEGYYDALRQFYVYNYTDQVGNVRVSYADANGDNYIIPRDVRIKHCQDMGDGNVACVDWFEPGEVVDINNYYPFGFMHNYQTTSSNAYQYKYNGKELQETGMYDYGARFYMPDIGRWGVVDPLAEKMTRHNPYNYVFNNPIRFIDPDGRQGTDWYQKNGTNELVYFNGSGERDGYTHMGANPIAYSYGGTSEASAQMHKDASFTYDGKTYTEGESATVGPFTITSGVQPELSDRIINWISHLGNTGGDYYTGQGGAGLGGSSPFFRPEMDRIVNTDGYFGGILSSLGIGSFNPKMDRLEALLGFGQQVTGLADSVPGIIDDQKNKSFYGSIFTGTELIANPQGQVNGVRMTSETIFIDNINGSQLDSIKNKNKSDSLKYIRQTQQRADSLLNQMLKK